ncbi:MAG: pyridoxal phosphate-dependent aminotransferase [Halarsenatibacteraceae bacterium]
MQLSKKMENLGTEVAFDVLEEVANLTTAGRDIISLAIGEPNFTTPEVVKEAGVAAIRNDKTGYSPSAGILELREKVAEYLSETRGIDYLSSETIVAPGAKPFIFYGLLALVEPGMEVIYPSPGFPIYESVIELLGGIAVPLPLRAENNFEFSLSELKELISPRTGGIIINSPHNPTGAIISREKLALLADEIIKHDLWAISDEVYSELVYIDEAFSLAGLPGMKERTLLIDSFSKSYAMTGWRIGFAGGSKELVDGISKLITNSVSCTATFTQLAALTALEKARDDLDQMKKKLEERRDLVWQHLNRISGLSCQKPAGSYYFYADVTEICHNLNLADSKELQEYLLKEAGVALLHRECFGDKFPGEDREYIRISFASCSKDKLREAISRIERAITAPKSQVS